MWYSLAQIQEPTIVSQSTQIVRQVAPDRPKPPVIPVGLPAFMYRSIRVPEKLRGSEFQSLAYVAKRAGILFAHAGPDYALWDCPAIPYARPVPVYRMLRSLSNSYIPGKLKLYESKAGSQTPQWMLQVVNRKP